MQNSIVLFDFKGADVRITDKNGEPWFVAADVCQALGLKNVSKALIELYPDEKATISGSKVGINVSKLRVISEPGVYSLIFKSRKPEAVAFQKRVKKVVLPS